MARQDAGYMPAGGGGGSGRGRVSVSTRSTELDPSTKRMVKSQNKSAESYKVKDLDAMEANKIKYEKAKAKAADDLKAAMSAGKKAGAAVGLAAGIAADELARAAAKKKETQGTQAGHHVTDNDNHTRTVK